MPPWLAILLGVCGVVVTIGTILIQYGRERGNDAGEFRQLSADVERHNQEIKTLREWRHTVGNQQQATIAVTYFGDRLKRLEDKVFNGQHK